MIVAMKKATIFALRQDRDAILLALQRAGIIMVEENDGSIHDDMLPQAEALVQNADESLKFLKKYREKPGFFEDAPQVEYNDFMAAKTHEQQLADEARALRDDMTRLQGELAAADNALEQLSPWLPLDIPLDQLRSTRHSSVVTGYIPINAASALVDLQEAFPVSVQLLDRSAGGLAAFIVVHNDYRDALSEQLKELGFVTASPPAIEGTAAQQREHLLQHQQALRDELAELQLRASNIGAEVQSVEVLYDRLVTDLDRYRTPYGQTEATFYVQGWVVADRAGELDEVLRDATDAFDVALEDAAEDEKPPTLVHNRKVVTPFESITDMFSRPNPLEGIDPNAVMAPWYWILFGMMMADFGYGLSIVVLFWLFKKIKKPKGDFGKLVTVLMYGGFTTAFWGIMFGSYFGEAMFPPLIGFAPLDDPLMTLVLCFGIGALHLFCGFIVAAYYQFKAGDILGGIADNLCWILILCGLAMLLLQPLRQVAIWILLPALAFKLMFSRRDTKNPIKRLFSGIMSLVGITNHVSDVISYSRIMALILSGGVTGMVMNLMAGMLWGGFGTIFAILVYAFGHAFNLAMSMLSAYVHTSRLQYIEFFGKFYEGGGYPFRPLSVESKYTVIHNNKSA